MADEKELRELCEALENLRWTVEACCRAGGVQEWAASPSARRAKAVAAPRASAERISEDGGRKTEGPPASAKRHPSPTPQPSVPDVRLPSSDTRHPASATRHPTPDLRPPSSATRHPTPVLRLPSSDARLAEIRAALGECSRCRLHAGRTHLVFGEGSANSGLVFVGEGPGFDEDKQGRPFIGRAGKLLDRMIRAIGLQRADTYICNVVKCRPPNNRTPQEEEMAACLPFLFQQLEALEPKVICALGACASQALLGSSKPMWQVRAKIHLWRGIPLICTYHPAYLLRNPAQKAAAWQDLKEVLKLLG